jgi:hypothetical protein
MQPNQTMYARFRYSPSAAPRRRPILRAAGLLLLAFACGCEEKPPQYGVERQLMLPGRPQVWAVAPTLNLSGQQGVDPLLQSDLVYAQAQQVNNLTVIPVDRVVEVYTALHIDKVQSPDQAAAVCDALGADGLLIPTVTMFDPYDPPKLGASMQFFPHSRDAMASVDLYELARRSTPPPGGPMPQSGGFIQSVGQFDAENGSVRRAVEQYAAGRHDPSGPLGTREYLVDMDRFCSFAYHGLIRDLLKQVSGRNAPVDRPLESGTADNSSAGRNSRSGGRQS